jgi:Calcineurin-like phosphoesterase
VIRTGVGLCVVVGLAGCARPAATSQPVPALPRDEVAATLYLIGDAGDPDPAGEPVLRALGRELVSGGRERVVVFLGDNAYPRGLPPSGDPTRPEEERRLSAQVRAVTEAKATGYLVLGNHDWARFGKDGWNAARRQETFVDSIGEGRVVLLPRGGCPGPSTVDIADRVRLILLDTQWWLHQGPKPEDPTSSCPADADDEIVDSIQSAIHGAQERLVVVVGHHPLATGGNHGGYFGWKDHLFPLLQAVPGLWLPLPLIGSLYPTARQNGISPQDEPSRAYQHFIRVLSRAFAEHAPALYASGHDHNLQVIAGGVVPLQLVSGAGIYGHWGRATRIRGSLFAKQASGFGRLDISRSGRARLAVIEVDRAGSSREVFSIWVE